MIRDGSQERKITGRTARCSRGDQGKPAICALFMELRRYAPTEMAQPPSQTAVMISVIVMDNNVPRLSFFYVALIIVWAISVPIDAGFGIRDPG
jgi:hypothetical protein